MVYEHPETYRGGRPLHPVHHPQVHRSGDGRPPPAQAGEGPGDDWEIAADKGEKYVEPIMGVVRFLSMTTFVMAFIILLTGSMVDMLNMTRSAILYGFPPGFWFTLTILTFVVYALTKEWEGRTYGEVHTVPWRSGVKEPGEAEAEVY